MQIERAEEFISNLLSNELTSELYYHNYSHTKAVVKASQELASAEGVNGHDLLLLKTAAWFHDCGYVNIYEHHEEESCRIAKGALPDFGYSEEEIEIICNMIMKTRVPQLPETILEKILCDADLDYLGQNEFTERGKDLYLEWKRMGKVSDEKEFNRMQIHFL